MVIELNVVGVCSSYTILVLLIIDIKVEKFCVTCSNHIVITQSMGSLIKYNCLLE
jgi:hypothetical protein